MSVVGYTALVVSDGPVATRLLTKRLKALPPACLSNITIATSNQEGLATLRRAKACAFDEVIVGDMPLSMHEAIYALERAANPVLQS